MPISINDTVVMGDDGKFTSDFKPSMVGDEYADSKFFETTPDLQSLMKAAVDSKSALGKKLDGVIQKPGKNASEEDLAKFKTALQKELGAPDTSEEYEFVPPEGQTHDEEIVKIFKEVFHKHGVPKETANALVEAWDALQASQNEVMVAAQKEAFDTEVVSFKKTHTGDSLTTGTRTAAKAMIQFAGEDFVKQIQETKLIENSTNFEAWAKLGIMPSQVAIWENIGKTMKSDQAITSEGTPDVSNLSEAEQYMEAHYDHPTSVAERKARSSRG